MARPGPRPRATAWITAGAIVAALGVTATLAAVWPGYDAQQTPLDDASVWALQSGDGRRYARVNTQLRELDTIKQIENPSGIAQTADRLFLFADGDTRFADVSMATPADLDADAADAFQPTPDGTVAVSSAGDEIAYLTDDGGVLVASMSGGGTPRAIDPYAGMPVAEGQERPRFVADAVAIAADGTVVAYSSAESRVIRADAATGEILDDAPVAAGVPQDPQLTIAGDGWALLDAATGTLWTDARDEPIATGVDATARLQRAGPSGTVYIADAGGLVAVDLADGTLDRVVDDTVASGTPAAPDFLDGVVHAAWLPDGGAGGTLWTPDAGATPLDYAGAELDGDPAPEFRSNGTRMILNETRSGWVWTVPDGALVPSSQAWDSDRRTQQEEQQQLDAQRVVDPKPPVAVDDAFGVRAGRTVSLPVLLNDHDPNEDVLSVVPSSVTGLDPGFGAVTATHSDQLLVVAVTPEATGSATFSYQVTDGTSPDGLLSNVATVTLTVVPDEVNNPPVWCGVEACLSPWPSPQVPPGGTVSVSTLDAWVDPDGDPIYLSDAVDQSGVGSVAADPDGTVTYQHPDPNATESLSVPIALTVSDVRGASAEKELTVAVTPTPRLTAQSFATTGLAGRTLTVGLEDHVSGASGPVVLASASVVGGDGATATPNPAALGFAFQGGTAGSYIVQYTVRDDLAEATGTARITLLDEPDSRVTSPPLTAFVRPNEDTTVDVLAAVSNPAGRVLLVSDLRAETDPLATLSVDLVAQSLIRVSGSTDDGRPGTLGVVRYTVSDGTGDPNASARGEITIVLLPAPSAEPPIAVDDAVTVRAGAQVDIPVLANDTAPGGALIAVDPSRVVNESDAGLAFGTPQLVRYLAPQQPGTYAVSYTVFRVGFPELVDSARIVLTVLGADTNAAPVPRTLEGRVLSGSSVSIPFDGYGVDPDGDSVTLDRILSQPANGSAAISATGDAIVYTSKPGTSGQDAFTYQVRDALGATGTAQVRVGILDAQSDPSPVTYSDYLQVQVGDASEAVVHPTDNDLDPGGGELQLVSVRPNAQPGTAEYAALEAQLADVDVASGRVSLRAGSELGTFSFVYTVRNGPGDTAMGLIVMKVVRGSVPAYPVVTDTILTAETRDAFPSGVDVLSGKVSWSAGDASSLTLSLWTDVPGVSVSGSRISGAIPRTTLLIPFRVSGTSFAGQEVESYGFLRVPGDDDIRLSLRPSAADVQVDEKGSVEVDMAQAVRYPRGTTLQVDGGGVAAGGARAGARCSLVSGTVVRYDAGADAPWTDTCVVPVKLTSQADYTFVTLRIRVIAEDPQPLLRPASVTVGPGETATYDLRQMTTWAGREDWASLTYAVAYGGDQFTVTEAGGLLTIVARDASRPGREEPVVVTTPSHPSTASGVLTLTVGPAPSTLPKGATTSQQCSQADGSTSCTIPVIGLPGEVNPLPGTPLALVSVTGPANCDGVTFSVANPTTVRASWTASAPGAGDCTGSFVVADAQGRQSSGDRNGQVVLDLQGLPADPARIEWTSYTADTVTLRVTSSGSSYPAVTGYRVTGGGQEVTCPATGTCPAIPGTNGQKVAYRAIAVNAVGDSRGATTPVQAWPYLAPAAPDAATARPVPAPGNDGRTAEVTVTGLDPSTGRVTLSRPDGTRATTLPVAAGTSSVVFSAYDVGANSRTALIVTPATRFDVPPIPGGSAEGQTRDVTAYGVGIPALAPLDVSEPDPGAPGRFTVTATVPQANGVDAPLRIGIVDGGTCVTQDTGSDDTGSLTRTFTNLPLWQTTTITACAEYVIGGESFGSSSTSRDVRATGFIAPPAGDARYSIGQSPDPDSQSPTYSWTDVVEPSLVAPAGFHVVYASEGGLRTTDFDELFAVNVDPGAISAFSCGDGHESDCSAAVVVAPTADRAAYTALIRFPSESSVCASPASPPSPSDRPRAQDATIASTATPDEEAGTTTVTYTVTFTGRLDGLSDLTGASAYSVTCTTPPDDAGAP